MSRYKYAALHCLHSSVGHRSPTLSLSALAIPARILGDLHLKLMTPFTVDLVMPKQRAISAPLMPFLIIRILIFMVSSLAMFRNIHTFVSVVKTPELFRGPVKLTFVSR